MAGLRMVRRDVHDVATNGRRIVFHVPTTAMFELDDAGVAVYDLFKSTGEIHAPDIERHFDGRFPAAEIAQTIREFKELGILVSGQAKATRRQPVAIRNFPLSTMVINVTTGCNLACDYCYKEDLTRPSGAIRMDFETAARSIDLLLGESGDRERVNVVFFGGEPLSNMPLIKAVVAYAEGRCQALGKCPNFSLTTNATLLTEQSVDFLGGHNFAISLSIDGPKAVHDRHRKTRRGAGSYDLVAEKTRMLLGRYKAGPVGARVTVTAGAIDVAAIHHHLFHELGFTEVGFAPVTSDGSSRFKLTGDELAEFFENMKALGRSYRDAAIAGRNIGFSNLQKLLADLHHGNRKTLPCGAGVGLLGVEPKGSLALCHRFAGSDFQTFGTVREGIRKDELARFLEDAANLDDSSCRTCWIRNLCAGGCYHESYLNYHDPKSPTYLYCDLMRDWVDAAIECYDAILARNPDFLAEHIGPRGPSGASMDMGG
ncbi:MAG: quinohemoprotein amine dehydrogenase maturation protein [Sphingomonadales bacterium]